MSTTTRLYSDWIKHETNITVVSPSEWTSLPLLLKAVKASSQKIRANAIGYTFSKILLLKMYQTTFYSSLGDSGLGWTPLIVFQFSREKNRKTEKRKEFFSCGIFHSLLVTFRNTKTCRHRKIKQTRLPMKHGLFEEAIRSDEAQLASLLYNTFQATREWSAIFA